jgi:hypothetical protein
MRAAPEHDEARQKFTHLGIQDLSSGRKNPDKPWIALGRARKWD